MENLTYDELMEDHQALKVELRSKALDTVRCGKADYEESLFLFSNLTNAFGLDTSIKLTKDQSHAIGLVAEFANLLELRLADAENKVNSPRGW